MTFAPFQNESDALTLAGLTLENRIDHISIYGSLALTRDKAGLRDAALLRDLFSQIVSNLEQDHHLAETLTAENTTETVKNPFA